MTAAEHLKRRKQVDLSQPDAVVIGIGYALTDNVYSLIQRRIDFGPPFPPPQPLPSGADDFLAFINGDLRPFVREEVFPGVEFTREGIYGHSGGGLFVTYALITDPGMFDTFVVGSPSVMVSNGTILGDLVTRLGDGMGIQGEVYPSWNNSSSSSSGKVEGGGGGGGIIKKVQQFNETGPAVFIGTGELEQFPLRMRTQTEAQFRDRKAFAQRIAQTAYSHELYDRLVGSGRMRDVVYKEYVGQDHAGVGGSALMDGISYFLDW